MGKLITISYSAPTGISLNNLLVRFFDTETDSLLCEYIYGLVQCEALSYQ